MTNDSLHSPATTLALDAKPASEITEGLREAIYGQPGTPKEITPLSWLRSMLDACDTQEAVQSLGGDDPDAWGEMCGEVRQMVGALDRPDHREPAAAGAGETRERIAARLMRAFPEISELDALCAAENAFPECLIQTPEAAAPSGSVGEEEEDDPICYACNKPIVDADYDVHREAGFIHNSCRGPLAAQRPAPQAPTDDLVDRFAAAMNAKLRASEAKYGWRNGWLKPGWEADCQRDLARHVTKGDPLDVAAYAAFCWHHGWKTAPQAPVADAAGEDWRIVWKALALAYDVAPGASIPDIREAARKAVGAAQRLAALTPPAGGTAWGWGGRTMSRSGYYDDSDDQWAMIRWRGAVKAAIRGHRGQAFFRELLAALDAMPAKRLIANDLVREDSTGFENVCALGALGRARGLNMEKLDPEDPETVAGTFNIADALAREVVFENDEVMWNRETPEQRWARMRSWVASQIAPVQADAAEGRS